MHQKIIFLKWKLDFIPAEGNWSCGNGLKVNEIQLCRLQPQLSVLFMSRFLKWHSCLNLALKLCPRFVLMGSFLTLVGFAREQRVHLILFRWNSPPKQLAVSGGIICDSSNVSLPVTKKREIFAGENSIANTCRGTAGLSRAEDGCNC